MKRYPHAHHLPGASLLPNNYSTQIQKGQPHWSRVDPAQNNSERSAQLELNHVLMLNCSLTWPSAQSTPFYAPTDVIYSQQHWLTNPLPESSLPPESVSWESQSAIPSNSMSQLYFECIQKSHFLIQVPHIHLPPGSLLPLQSVCLSSDKKHLRKC